MLDEQEATTEQQCVDGCVAATEDPAIVPEDEPLQSGASAEDNQQEERGEHPQVYDVVLRKGVYGLGIYFTEARGHAIVDAKLPFYRLPNGELAPGEASGVIAPGDVLLAINGRDLQELVFSSLVEELRCIPIGEATLTFQRSRPIATLVLQASCGQAKQQASDEEEEGHPATAEGEVLRSRSNETDEGSDDDKRAKRWSVFQRLSSTAAAIAGGATAAIPPAGVFELTALEDLLSEMGSKLQTVEESLERERKCRFLSEKKNILYRNELLRLSEENTSLRYQLAKEKSIRDQKDAFTRTLHLAI